ncbi:MAG: FAD-dependent oxidoreductase [Syntrophorhabdaceae bacterium]|nr:FAD-dependent oxidoreductase [Syntrophorhabdaceae bacterium]
MEKYTHLFSPGQIGPIKTKNRIKYAATETNFNYGNGYVSDREVAYMEAQARGGAAIVTTQGAYPDPKGEGKGFKGMMSIADDRFIPGLARIAEAIKKHGALSCIQILHCGREGGVDLDYCLMPSYVPQRLSYFKKPRVMTDEEIKSAIYDHRRAARRALDAGYDMIELSGIVGYLISTFISSYTNKRQDHYGGDIKARCRLMMEIIHAVKEEVGGDFPVGIRLCGLELLDDRGGNSVEESIESFKLAEEAGADFLSVTIGWHESSQSVITRDVPMGHWLYVAEMVKRHVKVPVMMAFRQFLPEIPERAISEGKIDFWEVCRPMIADPALPIKAKEGREDEVIPCIACNECFSRLYHHQPIMCTVRPSLGHEAEAEWGYYGFSIVKKRKTITVIGGGPGGLQFSSVASKRGHRVILYEKEDQPGGNILLASRIEEGAEELLRPISYLKGECERNGVDLRLGIEWDMEMWEKEDTSAVVIASGAKIKAPEGIPNDKVYTPYDIIMRGIEPQGRIAIIGGQSVGLSVAIFLIKKGLSQLVVIEKTGVLGRDISPFYLWRHLQLMKKKGIPIYKMANVLSFEEKEIEITAKDRVEKINFDSLIMTERESSEELVGGIKNMGIDVFLIGDAKRPRRLLNAIHDGYRLGMEI